MNEWLILSLSICSAFRCPSEVCLVLKSLSVVVMLISRRLPSTSSVWLGLAIMMFLEILSCSVLGVKWCWRSSWLIFDGSLRSSRSVGLRLIVIERLSLYFLIFFSARSIMNVVSVCLSLFCLVSGRNMVGSSSLCCGCSQCTSVFMLCILFVVIFVFGW